MTLPDVYCIFNRARGMELISPDDLVEVATILRPLGLAMSIREFDSGVTVIQADSHDDRIMGQHIRALASQLGSVTSVDVSAQLRIPLTLAREHALIAEEGALLCRDECLDAIRFYPNMFSEWA
uniref:Vacuolar protein-sorting-associated protein 36 n=1 Tax=Florenciella parvula TaxID=236787 RepID=A0A7S2CAC2_9STRA|mmetsp:Transcript_26364/g.54285  ORF Transcript_26364/g.54285 Transcript_26364/m.54285 type:complete len:124 (+) Transcript_26364:1-372(+)|eukprot:CAMPEP_0182534934 /NCGR_PEP_ID=MMETSP1323-20130603/16647_1 /TAXON_ID=236787 /ORGANISM="Florenciella parvula, Strain RCC1693" /LENGTH=123 /DNA_ID=CAMNT_0024745007 /DNA_START=1 /DNA_END=372 /DNA_ORIENTATION=+